METIQYIGLDLQVATVVVVTVIIVAVRAIRSAWGRVSRDRVPAVENLKHEA